MTDFMIPVQTGKLSRYSLFPDFEGIIRVDTSVEKFLGLGSDTEFEIRKEFLVGISTHENGGRFRDLLKGWPIMPGRDKIFAILLYLGGEGWPLLQNREGQDEKSVLIGYFEHGTKHLVFQVEHEANEGKGEEIHLHGSPSDREEDSAVIVLKVN